MNECSKNMFFVSGKPIELTKCRRIFHKLFPEKSNTIFFAIKIILRIHFSRITAFKTNKLGIKSA